jgi:hypothetical protein
MDLLAPQNLKERMYKHLLLAALAASSKK